MDRFLLPTDCTDLTYSLSFTDLALSTSLLVTCISLPLLVPIQSMWSVNRRPPTNGYQNMVVMGYFLSDLLRSQGIRIGESRHPWRTPALFVTKKKKKNPHRLFQRISLPKCSPSAWTTWSSPSSALKLLMTCRNAGQTLPNPFLKSIKLWNKSCWCPGCFFMWLYYQRAVLVRSGLVSKLLVLSIAILPPGSAVGR